MNYPVLCYGEQCHHPAVYKIAALWSHGPSSELKTYGLSCVTCLPVLFANSLKRQKTARTLPGELGEKPGIYQLAQGSRDLELTRMVDLERQLHSE